MGIIEDEQINLNINEYRDNSSMDKHVNWCIDEWICRLMKECVDE